MIDKKLIREVGSSLYHIKRNVRYQWLMLVLNILLITVLTWLLAALLSGAQLSSGAIGIVIGTAVLVIVLRHYLGVLAAISSERASHAVKQQLREKIYRKLLSLGGSYHERVSTSEIVQGRASISWKRIFPVICRSFFTACWHRSRCSWHWCS